MKRLLAVAGMVCVVAGALPSALGAQRETTSGPAIRLVLLVAVDQFRADYLTRFEGEYQDGLKRLLTEGAVFTSASLEHYPTVTAVGHATMLSGAFPSDSGIIGNDWFDRETGATVQSVTDTTVKPIGAPDGYTASPRPDAVATIKGSVGSVRGTIKLLPNDRFWRAP